MTFEDDPQQRPDAIGNLRIQRDRLIGMIETAERERDAARAALRRIAKSEHSGEGARLIAETALNAKRA